MIFDVLKKFFLRQKKSKVEETTFSLPVVQTDFFAEEELTRILSEHSVWLKTNGSFGKKASFKGIKVQSLNFFMADLNNLSFAGPHIQSSNLSSFI